MHNEGEGVKTIAQESRRRELCTAEIKQKPPKLVEKAGIWPQAGVRSQPISHADVLGASVIEL